MSCCSSRICRSQRNIWSPFSAVRRPSLYFQWAATPFSASACISSVRIWISIISAFGPKTVVWSDW